MCGVAERMRVISDEIAGESLVRRWSDPSSRL